MQALKSLPELFIEKLKSVVPPHKFQAVIKTFGEKSPTTFRVNTLKASVAGVFEELKSYGILVERVPWLSEAMILRKGTLRDLQETALYKEGRVYVQNLSSMVPSLVLNPQPGEKVLDLTAAPGSKTTQMAAMMQNQGEILANDNNKIRFFKLKANTELQEASIVKLSLHYGESFGRKFPETFDRILLDAPCSAEGRFSVLEPSTYRYWKPHKVKEMYRKQRKLIIAAAYALRTGGVMVYSTCTFSPEENEGVVDWILKKCSGSLQLEKISLPFPNQLQGITNWQQKEYLKEVKKARRILPSSSMEGFFIAKFRKAHPCA